MKSTFVTGIISLVVISGLAILWAAERAKPHAPPQANSQTASGYGMKLLRVEVSTTSISSPSSQGSAGGSTKTTLPGSAEQGGQTP